MRTSARFLQQARRLYRFHRGEISANGLGKTDKVSILNHPVVGVLIGREADSYLNQSLLFFRAVCTNGGSLSTTITLPSNWRKKRIHFHDFMLNVHSRLQVRGTFIFISIFSMHKGVADPLEVVAAEISDESILLCLDEFMVCSEFMNRQWFGVLVSTSNRAPDQLYEGGLQRDLFLPFIETLKVFDSYFMALV
ncbi:hypothetical protein GW17_00060749 [Ensete ventricosum]|nr:hypothetical protein GW17_00060749 [Ensete ventricosum]